MADNVNKSLLFIDAFITHIDCGSNTIKLTKDLYFEMEETVRSIEVTLRRNMLKKKSTAITELKPISKNKKKWLVELDQVRESLTNRNTELLPYQRLDLNNGNFSKELRE